jgi:hypothetical protein
LEEDEALLLLLDLAAGSREGCSMAGDLAMTFAASLSRNSIAIF